MQAYKAAGFNRNQFAKRLGTVYHNVIAWEGGTEPGVAYLIQIANETGASLDWLLRGIGAPPKPRTRLERDSLLRAVEDFLERLTPIERAEYDELDADWGRGLAFTDLRSRGIDNVTAAHVLDLWMQRRAERAGKRTERAPVKVALPANRRTVARKPTRAKRG